MKGDIYWEGENFSHGFMFIVGWWYCEDKIFFQRKAKSCVDKNKNTANN